MDFVDAEIPHPCPSALLLLLDYDHSFEDYDFERVKQRPREFYSDLLARELFFLTKMAGGLPCVSFKEKQVMVTQGGTREYAMHDKQLNI